MSIKSGVIILVLSVVVTYGISIADSIINNTLVAGSAGLPLKFASGSMFGGSDTDYAMLLLDIIFWFVIVWVVWKGLGKLIKM